VEEYLDSSIILLELGRTLNLVLVKMFTIAIRVPTLDAFDLENITFDANVDCDEDEDDGGEDIITGLDIET